MTPHDLRNVTTIGRHAGFQELPQDDLARIQRALEAQKKGSQTRGRFDRTGALQPDLVEAPAANAQSLASVTTIRRHG